MSLRDVQRLARQNGLEASVSSGYLSVLERDGIREPSPRVLHTLAAVYEVDYMELMRRADYIPLTPDRRRPRRELHVQGRFSA